MDEPSSVKKSIEENEERKILIISKLVSFRIETYR